jgi:hypothetical protein
MTCVACSVIRTRYTKRGAAYRALRLSTVLTRYRTQHGGGHAPAPGCRVGGRSSDV